MFFSRSFLLLILAFISIQFGFSAEAEMTAIPFENEASSTFKPDHISTDFLSVQKKELKAAERQAIQNPKNSVFKIFDKKNKKLVADLTAIAKKNTSQGISKMQAEMILSLIRQHPVVGPAAAEKYDSWDQQVGFCFGRAAFVHWELLRRSIPSTSIGKIFLVGNLALNLQTGSFWDYHMATIVRDQEQGWWVIDPLIDRVLPVSEWMQQMHAWALSPKYPEIRFYFSDPVKMLPIPGKYTTEQLFFTGYKGYFQDLFAWFKNNPLKAEDSFMQTKLNFITKFSTQKSTNNLLKGDSK